MSSPPHPLTWQTFVEDCIDTQPPQVFERVLAVLEPHRFDSLLDDFDEDEHSWRDYGGSLWLLIPAAVRAEVARIVRERLTLGPTILASASPGGIGLDEAIAALQRGIDRATPAALALERAITAGPQHPIHRFITCWRCAAIYIETPETTRFHETGMCSHFGWPW